MERAKLRKPAFAGQFYNATAPGLKKEIEILISDKNAVKANVLSCLLPHAGYMYSGRVAADTVSQINIKDRVILLGPNHTGYGVPFSLVSEGIWQTPLGEVQIDTTLAREILKHSRYLEDDSAAHMYEHSLEVELPILQYFKPDFKFVPVIILSGEINILKEIGRGIAAAIKESNLEDSVLIVASSDMTHYEPQTQAAKKDRQAIQAILELNEDKLSEEILRYNISMCGYAPVAVMLAAAKSLGAKNARLVKYQTSGDVTGDLESVVGYAGIIIN